MCAEGVCCPDGVLCRCLQREACRNLREMNAKILDRHNEEKERAAAAEAREIERDAQLCDLQEVCHEV